MGGASTRQSGVDVGGFTARAGLWRSSGVAWGEEDVAAGAAGRGRHVPARCGAGSAALSWARIVGEVADGEVLGASFGGSGGEATAGARRTLYRDGFAEASGKKARER